MKFPFSLSDTKFLDAVANEGVTCKHCNWPFKDGQHCWLIFSGGQINSRDFVCDHCKRKWTRDDLKTDIFWWTFLAIGVLIYSAYFMANTFTVVGAAIVFVVWMIVSFLGFRPMKMLLDRLLPELPYGGALNEVNHKS